MGRHRIIYESEIPTAYGYVTAEDSLESAAPFTENKTVILIIPANDLAELEIVVKNAHDQKALTNIRLWLRTPPIGVWKVPTVFYVIDRENLRWWDPSRPFRNEPFATKYAPGQVPYDELELRTAVTLIDDAAKAEDHFSADVLEAHALNRLLSRDISVVQEGLALSWLLSYDIDAVNEEALARKIDSNTLIASKAFGVKLEEVTPQMRAFIKNALFAWRYSSTGSLKKEPK